MALPSPLQPNWKKKRLEFLEKEREKKRVLLEQAEKNRENYKKKQEKKTGEVNVFLEKNPNLREDLNLTEDDFGVNINENLGNDEGIYREIERPKPSLTKRIKDKIFDWRLKRNSKKLAKIQDELKTNDRIPTFWEFSYGYNPIKYSNFIFAGETFVRGKQRNSRRRWESCKPAEIIKSIKYLIFLVRDELAKDRAKYNTRWYDETEEDFEYYIRSRRYPFVNDAKSATNYLLMERFYNDFIKLIWKCYLMISLADMLWFCKTPQMYVYIRLYNPDILKEAKLCFAFITIFTFLYFLFNIFCLIFGLRSLLTWFRIRFVIVVSSYGGAIFAFDQFYNLEIFTYYWALYFPFSMYCFYTYTQALWGTEEEILYENFLELFSMWFVYSVIFILPKKSTPFHVEMHMKGMRPLKKKEEWEREFINIRTLYMLDYEKTPMPPEAEHLNRLFEYIGTTALKQKKKEVMAIKNRTNRLMKAYGVWFNLEGIRGEGTLQTLITFRRHKYFWRVFWNKGFWVEC